MDTSTRIIILVVKVVAFGERKKNEGKIKRSEIRTLLTVDIFEASKIISPFLPFHYSVQMASS